MLLLSRTAPGNVAATKSEQADPAILPKGTDFRKVTRDELAEVERSLNSRPQKAAGLEDARMLFEGVKLLN